MIAVAALVLIGLIVLAWTRDGLTLRQLVSWICGRSSIRAFRDDFTAAIDQHRTFDADLAAAIERSKAIHPSNRKDEP